MLTPHLEWVSYDDEDTLKLKVDYANQNCLGGLMVWASSLDDGNGDAAAALSNANGRSNLKLSNAGAANSNPLTAVSCPDCILSCANKPSVCGETA